MHIGLGASPPCPPLTSSFPLSCLFISFPLFLQLFLNVEKHLELNHRVHRGFSPAPRWCAAAITKAAKEGMFAELKNQPCFCSRFYFKPQGAPGQWGAVNTSAGLSQGSGTHLHFLLCKVSTNLEVQKSALSASRSNILTTEQRRSTCSLKSFAIFCPPHPESNSN